MLFRNIHNPGLLHFSQYPLIQKKKKKTKKNRKSFFTAFFIAELVLSNNKKVYAQIKNLLKHIDMF